MVGLVVARFAFQVPGQTTTGKAGCDFARDVFGDTDVLGCRIHQCPIVIPHDDINRHEQRSVVVLAEGMDIQNRYSILNSTGPTKIDRAEKSP